MAWFEYGASRIYCEGTGSGEAVLLLPGLTQSFEDFEQLRSALAAKHRVIAAEPPGSDRSLSQCQPDLSALWHLVLHVYQKRTISGE
jgi:hypothetical protein